MATQTEMGTLVFQQSCKLIISILILPNHYICFITLQKSYLVKTMALFLVCTFKKALSC